MKIIFAGDYAPCRRYEKSVIEKKKTVFGNLVDDILESDISFVNLETPLTINDKPIKKAGPNIKAHPDCIHAIVEAGFSIAGLANNHILDFGEQGLEDTLYACHEVGLSTCGAGKNLQAAQEPLILENKGVRIGFIAVAENEFSIAEKAVSGAAPLDPIENSLLIDKLRKQVDLLFLIIHGGNEYFPYPRPGLRKICKFFIDRGSDGIFCSHAHVPGTFEFYNGKPIVYSLGNLIFDHHLPPDGWHQGYAFKMEYDQKKLKLTDYSVIPYTQSVDQGGVIKTNDYDKKLFISAIEECNRILGDDIEYKRVWDDFCDKVKPGFLLQMFLPFRLRGARRFYDILPIENILIPQNYLHKRFNLLQCESHMEIIQSIMKNLIHHKTLE